MDSTCSDDAESTASSTATMLQEALYEKDRLRGDLDAVARELGVDGPPTLKRMREKVAGLRSERAKPVEATRPALWDQTVVRLTKERDELRDALHTAKMQRSTLQSRANRAEWDERATRAKLMDEQQLERRRVDVVQREADLQQADVVLQQYRTELEATQKTLKRTTGERDRLRTNVDVMKGELGAKTSTECVDRVRQLRVDEHTARQQASQAQRSDVTGGPVALAAAAITRSSRARKRKLVAFLHPDGLSTDLVGVAKRARDALGL